ESRQTILVSGPNGLVKSELKEEEEPVMDLPTLADFKMEEVDVKEEAEELQRPFELKHFPTASRHRSKGRVRTGNTKTERFKCGICRKILTTKHGFKYHNYLHTGERRFWCDRCGKGFFDSSNLKSHQRRSCNGRPFSCTLCPLRCFSMGTLNGHLRSAHNQLIHAFPHCERTFTLKSEMLKHVSSHSVGYGNLWTGYGSR
ncbi:hypothetical protein PFISCL1PPCAC_4383, partial [Pristionchus fissidentatus]